MMSIHRRIALVSVASVALAVSLGSGGCSHSDPITLAPNAEAGGGAVFIDPDSGSVTPDAGLTTYCAATSCTGSFATCARSRFPCDVNLLTDPLNCGSCGFSCGLDNMHSTRTCVNGKCAVQCRPGTADCNGIVDDDCEVVFGSNGNCDSCGDTCPDPAKPCIYDTNTLEGTCGCPTGQTYCNKACVNLASSDKNCSACGQICDPTGGPDAGVLQPSTHYGCGNFECGKVKCNEGLADCDDNIGNGCEVSLLSNDHCGSCDNACAPGQSCVADNQNKPRCVCPPGATLCGNYCYLLGSDPHNCGGCGIDCTFLAANKNGIGTCSYGSCDFHCSEGAGDCNGDPADGCEVNLSSDQHNCGTCGNECDVFGGQPCIGGKCAVVACGDGGTPQ